jgi:hypothetical protein
MTTKAPVPGAVRITKLAPAVGDETPINYVARRMAARGWTVHVDHATVAGEGYTPYVLVIAWATPPGKEE